MPLTPFPKVDAFYLSDTMKSKGVGHTIGGVHITPNIFAPADDKVAEAETAALKGPKAPKDTAGDEAKADKTDKTDKDSTETAQTAKSAEDDRKEGLLRTDEDDKRQESQIVPASLETSDETADEGAETADGNGKSASTTSGKKLV